MSHKLKTEDIKIGNRVRPLPDTECPATHNNYVGDRKVVAGKWYVVSDIEHCDDDNCRYREKGNHCPGRPILNNGVTICGWGSPYEYFEPEPEWD